ncbi:efflux RND transporter periplasmic adaptor subunit [Nitrosovibrio tenuis]|uniref:HlyD family secretion protein n=1 Tax=Nitrosovibrio tenuis TaxID=1233 RepID=A0A1H7FZ12_9PROT|nr:efflux RND transporter periplasmic adaptor subunit [Nitrosovibrio tenuis]SEK29420.1 HlyD family secretion protein [Nitrosovibrio tenuis]
MTVIPTRRVLIILLTLLMAGGVGLWYWTARSESRHERYKTQPIDRGDIVQNISANGTLNPVVLVNVGTQVSGTVYKLFADFNDRVKEGQILVELDPSLFQAQLHQSEASVLNAQVALTVAQNKMARNVALKEQGFISPDALDVIVQQLEAARAQLAVNRAQLARDRTSLNYTIIRSPISGVVIARNVDIGQTVAASFQTPTLFQIAKDLRQMQIDTSVAEADIGHLHLGQTVNFTVDAFQDREFTGTVEQVRLNPTIQQNVVSYNVIVAVSNDDGVLLPGMTANVRFTVNQKKAVLRVPNAALRYKPSGDDADAAMPSAKPPGKHVLYRLEDGKPIAISIKTAVSDNNYTEVLEGDIKEGDKVIVREVGEKGEKSGSKLRFRMF